MAWDGVMWTDDTEAFDDDEGVDDNDVEASSF